MMYKQKMELLAETAVPVIPGILDCSRVNILFHTLLGFNDLVVWLRTLGTLRTTVNIPRSFAKNLD